MKVWINLPLPLIYPIDLVFRIRDWRLISDAVQYFLYLIVPLSWLIDLCFFVCTLLVPGLLFCTPTL